MSPRRKNTDKLAGYVRVSRVRGRKGETFLSPELQKEKVEQWAKLHDVTLVGVETELDVSGGKAAEQRRKLERLIERCEAHELGGIVVAKLDRFSRSTTDTLRTIERLKACGARFVAVADGLDTATDSGQFVLTILAALAQQQREQVARNWRGAIGDAVERRGIHVAAYAPAGYRRADEVDPKYDDEGDLIRNARLVLDPETAPHIRHAFELRAAEKSYQEIADYLTAAGVRPGGSKNGGWARSAVRKVLSNRVYLGEARGRTGERDANGKPTYYVKKGAHEALVDEETFERAQEPGRAFARNGATAALGWLAGIVHCAGCGHRLRVAGRGETATYHCLGHFASGKCPARSAVQVLKLDGYVQDHLLDAEDDPVVASLEDAIIRRNVAEAAVAEAQAELESYVLAASAIDREAFEAGLKARQADLDRARRTLAKTPDPDARADESGSWSEDRVAIIHEGKTYTPVDWGELPVGVVREHLRRFIGRVDVSKSRARGKGATPLAERVRVVWSGEAA